MTYKNRSKPKLNLPIQNKKSAYALICLFKKHAKANAWSNNDIGRVIKVATSKDYDFLVETLLQQ